MPEVRRPRVATPLVEIEGDEMARILWELVRERLVLPFVDVELRRFDLSLANRDATDDRVTQEAASAARELGVTVKCSTITPDERRVKQEGLKRRYPSPNGVIRDRLDGTIFREPVLSPNISSLVPHWSEPVVMARHAYAEQYKAAEIRVPGPGTLKLVWQPEDGSAPIEREVHRFDSQGVALGMFNVDRSIRGFARACFNYGLQRGYPVYFSHKATVLKQYDGAFLEIFNQVYQDEFAQAYAKASLHFEARLIDDMVASNLKWKGGYLWACKNYDGDVQSDTVAQGYGSPGMMVSLLMSPDGQLIETETAHGSLARHWQRWREDGKLRSNPVATIFAWSRGLQHRGRLDGTSAVQDFSRDLEAATLELLAAGGMTEDLAKLAQGEAEVLASDVFIDRVAQRLARRRAAA